MTGRSAADEPSEPFPNLPSENNRPHRFSTITLRARERGYTLERLENGKILFSENSTRAYYEPKDNSKWINGLSEGFLSTSIREIHAWADAHGVEDFDVTLFACSEMDAIRFELRINSVCFNRVRKAYGKVGATVIDLWSQKPAMDLIKISEAIAKGAAGVFRFCSKRQRIIFLPKGARIPFPRSVDQLTDAELQDVQETLLSFVSLHRRQSGFTATYSMGRWRKTMRAHIKIRFPDSDVLEDMRRSAKARQSLSLGSNSLEWRARL